MWSERPRVEKVGAVQTAHAPADRETYHRLVERLGALGAPPFEGPDRKRKVHRFGQGPGAVLVSHENADVTIRAVSRKVDEANEVLRAFLDATGERAAAEVGLTLALTPARVSVPANAEARWLRFPRSGDLEPRFRAHVPARGEARVHAEGWVTETMALTFMGGHEVRFRIWDPPDEDDIPLLDAAIANMCAAKPALLEEATEHVYRYYQDIAGYFGEEEREEYGIPEIDRAEDVWRHVQLGSRPSVTPSGTGSRYLHDGVAYVSFECNCDWEVEHGLCLVFIDGVRLGRVSSFDGHRTWAHAYADPNLLDVIYKPKR